MPLLKLTTTEKPAEAEDLMAKLSATLSEATGKPEQYIMVSVETADMMLGGEVAPSAYVDVRGIGGVTPEINANATKGICALLQAELSIPPERTYVTFTDVPASNWGWNNSTFG